jgi:lambda family phage tail tape measure protein
VGEDTAQSRLLKEQVTQLQAISVAGAKAIEKGAELAKVQAEVGSAVSATNEFFAKQAAILDQQNVAALAKYQAALDRENDSLRRKVDAQVDSIGMGRKEFAQQQQLNSIYARGADEIRRLEATRKNAGVNTKLLDAQIAAVQENTDKQVKIVQDGYARMDEAQSSWLNGARGGLQDFYDEADNIAGQTHDIFKNAFDGLGNSIADFVTKGKGNFKDLLGSVLDDLTRMSIKFEMSRALKSLFGMGDPGGGGSFLDGFADGGVFMNSPSLSAYSGTVVNRPTPFFFAKGAGIMGEAGPEAILPLHRGPNGKLGVTVNAPPAAMSGRGNVSISQTIHVQGRVDRRTASQIANESARKQRIAQSRDR